LGEWLVRLLGAVVVRSVREVGLMRVSFVRLVRVVMVVGVVGRGEVSSGLV
jgi:hypothetical protein